jgi:hypothetical protein
MLPSRRQLGLVYLPSPHAKASRSVAAPNAFIASI